MSQALLEKIKSFAETFYPVQMRQLIVEIDLELQKPDPYERIKELQYVCAEAYQFAGAYNAPDEVLDKLSAAGNGDVIPKESYLPIESPSLAPSQELMYTLKDIDEVLANIIVPDPVEIAWCRAKIAKALNKPS